MTRKTVVARRRRNSDLARSCWNALSVGDGARRMNDPRSANVTLAPRNQLATAHAVQIIIPPLINLFLSISAHHFPSPSPQTHVLTPPERVTLTTGNRAIIALMAYKSDSATSTVCDVAGEVGDVEVVNGGCGWEWWNGMERRRVDSVDRRVVVDEESVDVGKGMRRRSIGGNMYLYAAFPPRHTAHQHKTTSQLSTGEPLSHMRTSMAFFVTLSGPARIRSRAISGDGRVARVESEPAFVGGTTTGAAGAGTDGGGTVADDVVVPYVGTAVVPGGGLTPLIAGRSEFQRRRSGVRPIYGQSG